MCLVLFSLFGLLILRSCYSSPFALYGVTYVGGTVPTYAVFMRVAASVNPTHDSQNHPTGTIDIKGAWRSLTWSTLTMLLANMYFVAVLKYVAVMCMALFSIIHFVDHSSGYSGYRDAGFFFCKVLWVA